MLLSLQRGFLNGWLGADMLQPELINEVVIKVHDAAQFEQGDQIEQFCTLAETSSLHEALLSYWKPTWHAMSTVDSQTWQRVIAFFEAYVPKFRLDLGPIQPDQWYRALKRYKPTAARGVDGISHKEIFSHSL